MAIVRGFENMIRTGVFIDDTGKSVRKEYPATVTKELATKTAMFLAENLRKTGLKVELVSQEEAHRALEDTINSGGDTDYSVADLINGGTANGLIEVGEVRSRDNIIDLNQFRRNREIFHLSDGTVYGYQRGSTIYLTEDGINPNTPIHEYAHVWAKAYQKLYPEGWVELKGELKALPLWKALSEGDYSFIDNEDRLAGEVLAHIVGDKGEELLVQASREVLKEGSEDVIAVVENLRNRLDSFVARDVFGAEGLEFTGGITLGILRDFAEGRSPEIGTDKTAEMQLGNSATPGRDATVGYYQGDIVPSPDVVMVFGSNPEGRHGAGAAKVAREKFGAVYGVGEGLTGNAYALPTKDLRVTENNGYRSISPEAITESVKKLYQVARENPDKNFCVAYRNTDRRSLNGYTGYEMMDMFLAAGQAPENVFFSKEWADSEYLGPAANRPLTFSARAAGNSYEVSSRGDRRFSAFNVRFAEGTVIDGEDVSGWSVEEVYQRVIKRSAKGLAPASDSRLSVLYRGYATKDGTPAIDLDATVAGAAPDYVEGFGAKYHFTTDREEAEGYAQLHSERTNDLGPISRENKGYMGDYPIVGTYALSGKAKIARFEDVRDYDLHPERAEGADVVVLKRGTLSSRASEFIVREGAKELVIPIEKANRKTLEDLSFSEGYLPLWKIWAEQNPALVADLREKSAGKVLTDQFASTGVSQARALAVILNEETKETIKENNSVMTLDEKTFDAAAERYNSGNETEAEKAERRARGIYTEEEFNLLSNEERQGAFGVIGSVDTSIDLPNLLYVSETLTVKNGAHVDNVKKAPNLELSSGSTANSLSEVDDLDVGNAHADNITKAREATIEFGGTVNSLTNVDDLYVRNAHVDNVTKARNAIIWDGGTANGLMEVDELLHIDDGHADNITKARKAQIRDGGTANGLMEVDELDVSNAHVDNVKKARILKIYDGGTASGLTEVDELYAAGAHVDSVTKARVATIFNGATANSLTEVDELEVGEDAHADSVKRARVARIFYNGTANVLTEVDELTIEDASVPPEIHTVKHLILDGPDAKVPNPIEVETLELTNGATEEQAKNVIIKKTAMALDEKTFDAAVERYNSGNETNAERKERQTKGIFSEEEFRHYSYLSVEAKLQQMRGVIGSVNTTIDLPNLLYVSERLIVRNGAHADKVKKAKVVALENGGTANGLTEVIGLHVRNAHADNITKARYATISDGGSANGLTEVDDLHVYNAHVDNITKAKVAKIEVGTAEGLLGEVDELYVYDAHADNVTKAKFAEIRGGTANGLTEVDKLVVFDASVPSGVNKVKHLILDGPDAQVPHPVEVETLELFDGATEEQAKNVTVKPKEVNAVLSLDEETFNEAVERYNSSNETEAERKERQTKGIYTGEEFKALSDEAKQQVRGVIGSVDTSIDLPNLLYVSETLTVKNGAHVDNVKQAMFLDLSDGGTANGLMEVDSLYINNANADNVTKAREAYIHNGGTANGLTVVDDLYIYNANADNITKAIYVQIGDGGTANGLTEVDELHVQDAHADSIKKARIADIRSGGTANGLTEVDELTVYGGHADSITRARKADIRDGGTANSLTEVDDLYVNNAHVDNLTRARTATIWDGGTANGLTEVDELHVHDAYADSIKKARIAVIRYGGTANGLIEADKLELSSNAHADNITKAKEVSIWNDSTVNGLIEVDELFVDEAHVDSVTKARFVRIFGNGTVNGLMEVEKLTVGDNTSTPSGVKIKHLILVGSEVQVPHPIEVETLELTNGATEEQAKNVTVKPKEQISHIMSQEEKDALERDIDGHHYEIRRARRKYAIFIPENIEKTYQDWMQDQDFFGEEINGYEVLEMPVASIVERYASLSEEERDSLSLEPQDRLYLNSLLVDYNIWDEARYTLLNYQADVFSEEYSVQELLKNFLGYSKSFGDAEIIMNSIARDMDTDTVTPEAENFSKTERFNKVFSQVRSELKEKLEDRIETYASSIAYARELKPDIRFDLTMEHFSAYKETVLRIAGYILREYDSLSDDRRAELNIPDEARRDLDAIVQVNDRRRWLEESIREAQPRIEKVHDTFFESIFSFEEAEATRVAMEAEYPFGAYSMTLEVAKILQDYSSWQKDYGSHLDIPEITERALDDLLQQTQYSTEILTALQLSTADKEQAKKALLAVKDRGSYELRDNYLLRSVDYLSKTLNVGRGFAEEFMKENNYEFNQQNDDTMELDEKTFHEAVERFNSGEETPAEIAERQAKGIYTGEEFKALSGEAKQGVLGVIGSVNTNKDLPNLLYVSDELIVDDAHVDSVKKAKIVVLTNDATANGLSEVAHLVVRDNSHADSITKARSVSFFDNGTANSLEFVDELIISGPLPPKVRSVELLVLNGKDAKVSRPIEVGALELRFGATEAQAKNVTVKPKEVNAVLSLDEDAFDAAVERYNSGNETDAEKAERQAKGIYTEDEFEDLYYREKQDVRGVIGSVETGVSLPNLLYVSEELNVQFGAHADNVTKAKRLELWDEGTANGLEDVKELFVYKAHADSVKKADSVSIREGTANSLVEVGDMIVAHGHADNVTKARSVELIDYATADRLAEVDELIVSKDSHADSVTKATIAIIQGDSTANGLTDVVDLTVSGSSHADNVTNARVVELVDNSTADSLAEVDDLTLKNASLPPKVNKAISLTLDGPEEEFFMLDGPKVSHPIEVETLKLVNGATKKQAKKVIVKPKEENRQNRQNNNTITLDEKTFIVAVKRYNSGNETEAEKAERQKRGIFSEEEFRSLSYDAKQQVLGVIGSARVLQSLPNLLYVSESLSAYKTDVPKAKVVIIESDSKANGLTDVVDLTSHINGATEEQAKNVTVKPKEENQQNNNTMAQENENTALSGGITPEGQAVVDEALKGLETRGAADTPEARALLQSSFPATVHSGGARGADQAFGEIAAAYGMTVNHYYAGERSEGNAPLGNVEISQEDFDEGRVKAAAAAARNWGYAYYAMKDPRLVRNWAQVKHSDAVVAVGTIVRPGEKVFPDQRSDTRLAKNPCVAGGTGYAVSMAIAEGKPVYVFDASKGGWHKYDVGKDDFEKIDEPPVLYNFAGIGSRNISKEGREAIVRYVNRIQADRRDFGQERVKTFLRVIAENGEVLGLDRADIASQMARCGIQPGDFPALRRYYAENVFTLRKTGFPTAGELRDEVDFLFNEDELRLAQAKALSGQENLHRVEGGIYAVDKENGISAVYSSAGVYVGDFQTGSIRPDEKNDWRVIATTAEGKTVRLSKYSGQEAPSLDGRVFVSPYSSPNIPDDGLRVKISAAKERTAQRETPGEITANSFEELGRLYGERQSLLDAIANDEHQNRFDERLTEAFPQLVEMTSRLSSGEITREQFNDLYRTEILEKNKDAILSRVRELSEKAESEGRDVYLLYYNDSANDAHVPVLMEFLNENGIRCEVNPRDVEREDIRRQREADQAAERGAELVDPGFELRAPLSDPTLAARPGGRAAYESVSEAFAEAREKAREANEAQYQVYTLGMGTRSADAFYALVPEGVDVVIDIRNYPYNSKNRKFNKSEVEAAFKSRGVEYVHEKDLGGGNKDAYVNYREYAQGEGYKAALERVENLAREGKKVLLVTSEGNQRYGAAGRLVGQSLYRDGLSVGHITADSNGNVQMVPQPELVDAMLGRKRVVKGSPANIHFDSKGEHTEDAGVELGRKPRRNQPARVNIGNNYNYGMPVEVIRHDSADIEAVAAETAKAADMTVFFRTGAEKFSRKTKAVMEVRKEKGNVVELTIPNKYEDLLSDEKVKWFSEQITKKALNIAAETGKTNLTINIDGSSLPAITNQPSENRILEGEDDDLSANDRKRISQTGMKLDDQTGITEEHVREFMLKVMQGVTEVRHEMGVNFVNSVGVPTGESATAVFSVERIISPADSGIGESAILAAQALGIPSQAHATSNYTLTMDNETPHGQRLGDKAAFENRLKRGLSRELTPNDLTKMYRLNEERRRAYFSSPDYAGLLPEQVLVLQKLNYTDADIITMARYASETLAGNPEGSRTLDTPEKFYSFLEDCRAVHGIGGSEKLTPGALAIIQEQVRDLVRERLAKGESYVTIIDPHYPASLAATPPYMSQTQKTVYGINEPVRWTKRTDANGKEYYVPVRRRPRMGRAAEDNTLTASNENVRVVSTAPTVLFYKGDINLLSHPSVSMVGGDETASKEAVQEAGELASKVAQSGATVVTTMEGGTQKSARDAAMKEGGPVAAVTNKPLDAPSDQESVNEIVRRGGLVMTEGGVRPSRDKEMSREEKERASMVQFGLSETAIALEGLSDLDPEILGREAVLAVFGLAKGAKVLWSHSATPKDELERAKTPSVGENGENLEEALEQMNPEPGEAQVEAAENSQQLADRTPDNPTHLGIATLSMGPQTVYFVDERHDVIRQALRDTYGDNVRIEPTSEYSRVKDELQHRTLRYEGGSVDLIGGDELTGTRLQPVQPSERKIYFSFGSFYTSANAPAGVVNRVQNADENTARFFRMRERAELIRRRLNEAVELNPDKPLRFDRAIYPVIGENFVEFKQGDHLVGKFSLTDEGRLVMLNERVEVADHAEFSSEQTFFPRQVKTVDDATGTAMLNAAELWILGNRAEENDEFVLGTREQVDALREEYENAYRLIPKDNISVAQADVEEAIAEGTLLRESGETFDRARAVALLTMDRERLDKDIASLSSQISAAERRVETAEEAYQDTLDDSTADRRTTQAANQERVDAHDALDDLKDRMAAAQKARAWADMNIRTVAASDGITITRVPVNVEKALRDARRAMDAAPKLIDTARTEAELAAARNNLAGFDKGHLERMEKNIAEAQQAYNKLTSDYLALHDTYSIERFDTLMAAYAALRNAEENLKAARMDSGSLPQAVREANEEIASADYVTADSEWRRAYNEFSRSRTEDLQFLLDTRFSEIGEKVSKAEEEFANKYGFNALEASRSLFEARREVRRLEDAGSLGEDYDKAYAAWNTALAEFNQKADWDLHPILDGGVELNNIRSRFEMARQGLDLAEKRVATLEERLKYENSVNKANQAQHEALSKDLADAEKAYRASLEHEYAVLTAELNAAEPEQKAGLQERLAKVTAKLGSTEGLELDPNKTKAALDKATLKLQDTVDVSVDGRKVSFNQGRVSAKRMEEAREIVEKADQRKEARRKAAEAARQAAAEERKAEKKEEKKPEVKPENKPEKAEAVKGRVYISSFYSNIPENGFKVSIANSVPRNEKFSKVDAQMRSANPDYMGMVDALKKGNITENEYAAKFVAILERNKEAILAQVRSISEKMQKEQRNAYLLCHEAPGNFCHRYILMNWLKEQGVDIRENPADAVRYKMADAKIISYGAPGYIPTSEYANLARKDAEARAQGKYKAAPGDTVTVKPKDGRFGIAVRDGKAALINADMQFVSGFYDKVQLLDNGSALVTSKAGGVDKSNIVFPDGSTLLPKGQNLITGLSEGKDGVCVVKVNIDGADYFNHVDFNARKLVSACWSFEARDFDENGLAIVRGLKDEKSPETSMKYNFIDREGKLLLKKWADEVELDKTGKSYALVTTNGITHAVSKTGADLGEVHGERDDVALQEEAEKGESKKANLPGGGPK